jgi:hypothetical protein
MAGANYTSPSITVSQKSLNGGLNSTAGPLELGENESSDLQNIDFDKFGSVLKRNGFACVGTATLASGGTSNGLWWYEANISGTATRYAINVAASTGTANKVFKMDALDGNWDDISGPLLTKGYQCDFENFLNKVYITNGNDLPVYWAGTGTCVAMTVPTNLVSAKFVKQFNNYLFLGNVALTGTAMPSRIYWSNIKDTSTWGGDQFIEISKDDGQEITGLKVLQDRLVIYKTRAIYNLFFTGDADIPFILPGGGRSNSSVGCIAPYSIQELENGHVFLAADGLYFYDGNNSYKLSYKIYKTLIGYNEAQFNKAVSCVYKAKNRYMLALPSTGVNRNRVIVWDYFNNAFSIYTGINPSAMATFYTNGFQEATYFCDYRGYTYLMDTGTDDYPANTVTPIDAYYYTNWKTFEDLCDQKGVPHLYIYYQTSYSTLTFCYSYDFQVGDQYTHTFNLTTGGVSLYGNAIYDYSVYGGVGGAVSRRDLTGRGRSVRFKFANATLGETFQIDGIGSFTHAETNV